MRTCGFLRGFARWWLIEQLSLLDVDTETNQQATICWMSPRE